MAAPKNIKQKQNKKHTSGPELSFWKNETQNMKKGAKNTVTKDLRKSQRESHFRNSLKVKPQSTMSNTAGRMKIFFFTRSCNNFILNGSWVFSLF